MARLLVLSTLALTASAVGAVGSAGDQGQSSDKAAAGAGVDQGAPAAGGCDPGDDGHALVHLCRSGVAPPALSVAVPLGFPAAVRTIGLVALVLAPKTSPPRPIAG